MQKYFINKLTDLGEPFALTQENYNSGMRWTDDKIFLIELIYAIYFKKSISKGKMWQLFGEGMNEIINELNEALAA